jgi:hypothetical protein
LHKDVKMIFIQFNSPSIFNLISKTSSYLICKSGADLPSDVVPKIMFMIISGNIKNDKILNSGQNRLLLIFNEDRLNKLKRNFGFPNHSKKILDQ